MKIFEFDSIDFPYESSEEHLRLSVEFKVTTPSVVDFLQRCMQNSNVDIDFIGQPFEECFWNGEVQILLAHFYPSVVAELKGAKVSVLINEQTEHSLLIETENLFLVYEWSSAARSQQIFH